MSEPVPLHVLVHLTAALVALILGAIVLWRPKGTVVHKAMGRTWVVLMAVLAVGSFWIRGIGDGGLSIVHVLSAWILISISFAILSIRRGNMRRHRGHMIGSYVGLVGAGAGTLFPGRLIGEFVQGLF